MSQTQQRAAALSDLVDQLARIMPQYFRPHAPPDEPREPGPHAGLDLAIDRPNVARLSSDDARRETMIAAEKWRKEVWQEYEAGFATPPAVAGSARRDEMGRLCRQIQEAHGKWTNDQVDVMATALADLKVQHAEAKREFEDKKKLLAASLDGKMKPGQEVAPGATQVEAAGLESRRTALQNAIDAADATMDTLAPIDADISGFGDMIEAVRAKVAERLKRKEDIEQAAADVALHPDAPGDALVAARKAVTVHLSPEPPEPLSDDALDLAVDALGKLTKAADAVNARAAVQRLKLDEYRGQLTVARVQTQKATAIAELSTEKLPPLEALLSACEKSLPEPPFDDTTDDRLNAFPPTLKKLQVQAAANVAKSARRPNRGVLAPYFKDELAEITAQWERLLRLPGLPDKFASDEPIALKTARATVTGKVPDAGPLDELGGRMQKALDGAREEIARQREGAIQTAAEWQSRKDKLRARVSAADPANVAGDFAAELEMGRKRVSTPLDGKLSEGVLQSAERDAGAFVALWKRAERDAIDGVQVAAIRKRLDTSVPETLKDARTPVQAEISAAWEAAKAAADAKGTTRNMSRACASFEALEKRLGAVQGEAPKAEAATKSLATRTVGDATVTLETAQQIYDLLGPDVLASLGAGNLGDASVQTVCEAFHGATAEETKALRALFLEGLAGHGGALVAVVRTGDGKALRTLATSFGGDGETAMRDRRNLGSMVGAGGLGEHPEVLGDLLKFGVKPGDVDADRKRGANVTSLKTLGTSFGGQQRAPALKTLLDDCGFGARPTSDRPGAFAEILLNDGCSADDLYRFARDDTNLDKGSKVNLKAVMTTGGLGDRPAALAPLVKGSGLSALKNIGNAFARPADRVNLKTVMDNGGLSGEAPQPGDPANPARQHEHPDTLAKVFKDGLGESGEDLVTFAAAFAPVPAQSKMMLDAWNEYPDPSKSRRQPGKQMALVIDRMDGTRDEKIGKLQTQFTQHINQIGDIGKRQSAFRFAPGLATEAPPANLTAPPNMPNDYVFMANNQDGNSLCRRHVPKHFARGYMNNQNSLWPVGTDAAKLTGYMRNAIQDLTANGQGLPPDRAHGRVGDVDGGRTAAVGAEPNNFNAAQMVINHFHPSAGWPQTADPKEAVTFARRQMELMLDAVGVP